MKRTLLLAGTALVAASLLANGCGKRETTKYACPMHPNVVQDQPGKCPQCGMDLEPKK